MNSLSWFTGWWPERSRVRDRNSDGLQHLRERGHLCACSLFELCLKLSSTTPLEVLESEVVDPAEASMNLPRKETLNSWPGVCALSQGAAINVQGNSDFTGCTFLSHSGSTVYVTTTATISFDNCTFTVDANAATDDKLIYSAGRPIDYGICPPGTNPGVSGSNVFVSGGNFTGCPFQCSKGMWGPGGPTDVLRNISTDCGVGCKYCPEGAVCDAYALPAPNNCTAGHYNPDRGSQDSISCRKCERCGCLLHSRNRHPTPCVALSPLVRGAPQWKIPNRGRCNFLRRMQRRQLLRVKGQHQLQHVWCRRLLPGGGG